MISFDVTGAGLVRKAAAAFLLAWGALLGGAQARTIDLNAGWMFYRDDARQALARLAVAQKHPNEAFKQYEALSREAAKPAVQAESALKAGLIAKDLGQIDTATNRARELGATVLLEPREGPAGWRSVIATPEAGEIAFWQQKGCRP